MRQRFRVPRKPQAVLGVFRKTLNLSLKHLPPDMKKGLQGLSNNSFLSYVSSLRYIPDEVVEQVRAPWIVFEMKGGDCDDVSNLCAVWAILHGKQWRWILWGQGDTILHISTEIRGIGNIDPFGSRDYKPLYYGNWN